MRTLLNWIREWQSSAQRPKACPRRNLGRFLPAVELLEGRALPSVMAAPSLNSALVAPAVQDTAAPAATINQQIVAFCNAHLKQKVGGGECAQLACEALRVAGANFIPQNPNNSGNYVWGTLIVTITPKKDSAPKVPCQVGDVIQFIDATFSDGEILTQHTAIVAAVDAAGRPTEVYDQNVAGNRTEVQRPVAINLNTVTKGTVNIYQAVARKNVLNQVQFSVVNNTTAEQTVTLYFNGKSVTKIPLTQFNTAGSYQMPTVTGAGAWTIGINGTTIKLTNAGGYEVFTTPQGKTSIQAI